MFAMPRSISSGRHVDVRLVGLLLLEPLVDHAVEQLLVHLLLLHADDVRVVRLHADLDARGGGPVQELGPEDGPLADDGDDALDDGGVRGCRDREGRGRGGQHGQEQPGETHRGNT